MVEVVRKEQVWKDSSGNLTNKESEVAGSWDMPLQNAPSKVNPGEKPKKLSTPAKVAALFGWEEEKVAAVQAMDDELETMFKEAADSTSREQQGEEPDTNLDTLPTAEQPAALPQNKKVLQPHVDTTSHEPPKVVQEKKAGFYAMPSIGRYPLDNLHQIKAASQYWDENWKQLEPADRREFASNLVKRASAVGQPISLMAEHYGADGYAPRIHVLTELAVREDLVKEAENQGYYDELKEQIGTLPPDVFAHTLHEIDKHAGLDESYDRDCMDPWYTTFGSEKTADAGLAEGKTVEPKDAIVLGSEYTTVPDLVQFAASGSKLLKARFGDDFTSEFQKDPTGIFDSLPRDQKLVIMRMVNNSRSLTQGASTS